jgi:hypothetical protein
MSRIKPVLQGILGGNLVGVGPGSHTDKDDQFGIVARRNRGGLFHSRDGLLTLIRGSRRFRLWGGWLPGAGRQP